MKKIIKLTESDLTKIVKRIVEYVTDPNVANTTIVSNLRKKNELPIKKHIFEPDKTVFNTYLNQKKELIPIYKEIERALGDKFTKNHFDREIKYSGNLKNLSNSLSPNAISMFKKLLKKYRLENKVTIDKDSYRSYQKQKDIFIKAAKKNGGKINDGLRQAALPGFSQHHTGKALDISPSKLITDKMLEEFNFKRPYKVDTGFRMPEPWHILYMG
jgi:LAS superfamily LD-carboxypeptidase LdcB